MLDDAPLPPLNRDPPPQPRLAPAWVALFSAWLGMLTLLASMVFPILPGSRDPRAELEHLAPYSFADKFLPFPMYGSVVAMFLGGVVIYQMRRERRPLPEELVAQRVQAWANCWSVANDTPIVGRYDAKNAAPW